MSLANKLRSGLLSLTALTAIGSTTAGSALAQQPQKPNILVIMADDIGYTTDNGAETFTWPDGGTTAFRGERRIRTGRAGIASLR